MMDFWSAPRYVKADRNSLQEKNALDMLKECEIPEDRPIKILDVGSGAGNITAILAEKYPLATVIGIDPSPSMITNATENYASQYDNLIFHQIDVAAFKSEEKFDLVVSFNCLHWVDNLEDVFEKNIMPILNVDAKLCFMLYPRVDALWKAIDGAALDPMWSSFFSNYKTPYYDYNKEKLDSILKKVGFSDVNIIVTEKTVRYENGAEGLKQYIWGFLPLLNLLPNESTQSKFLDLVMIKYLEYLPLNETGECTLPYQQLDVAASICLR